ncbi:TIGR03016 family PEP-CTERM system-associated outer membrane protein [Sneathiella sp.]|jgi:uncharacterized protein (PEP-CTERM system associated)|uniref:TIGR03016 family PEP-CTERM system-associated outer membrane protein n=1 Tax=Sneathiella sp. TaxID=1964365 RepID=UPI0039E34271
MPTARLKKRLSCYLMMTVGVYGASFSQAVAGEWDFSPFVGVSEQFTDNARSSTTNKESDFITSVDLGFTLSGETRKTELTTSYSISQDYYARNHDLDGYRQNFLGSGSIELIDESFFVDARVTFTEENLGETGSTSATDRTQASDRTQVFNGQISPYYVQDFGGWATGVARYSYSETIFKEPDVGASTTDTPDRNSNEFRLTLDSGRRFARLSWSADTGIIKSESDDGDNFEHFSSIGTAQLPINRLFSIIGTVGYDDFDADNIDNEEISGAFGGAGIRLHPSSRTDASFQIGYRFGEPVFDMDVQYAPTSADQLSATYRVSVQTADQSLANTRLLDDNGDLIKPNFSVTDYVDDVTKSNNLEVRWTRTRGRNNYGLSGNYIEREFLSDNTDDTTLSISGNFGRRLTPRADLSLTTGYSETLDTRTSGSGEISYEVGATYSYDFGRGFTGNVSYNFLNRDNKVGEDLTENALSVSFRKNF